MQPKPRSIKLVDYQEELLPSGRKLLHCIFKDTYGTSQSQYRWTPPWKGEFGALNILRKALQIEEWNDYDGVWSDELRRAAQEIPILEEMWLPVKIELGELVEILD